MGRKPKDKSNEPKKMGIFDWLKEIMTSKRSWSTFTDEDKSEFNCFMINKFLSMNQNYIEIVNYAQFIPYSEKEKYYNIYCEMIPKGYTFSKYIKGNKKTSNKEILEKISKYYECSLSESEQYVEFLGKDGVSEILIKLGTEEKEIKKLIKEI